MKSFFVIFIFVLKSIHSLPVLEEPTEKPPLLTTLLTTLQPTTTTTKESSVIPEQTTTTATTTVVPPRRLISFDQRQDGKFNFRADLENFLIVVMPSNPSSQISLLDLLTRSALKRNHAKHFNKKNTKSSLPKIHESEQNQQLDYVIGENSNKNVLNEFVEGRTPYKVDISSTETGTNTELQLVPTIGVGRSPHLHRTKPVPLEIGNTVASTRSADNNLQHFSTLFPVVTVGSQRKSKSLAELSDDINTNSVILITETQRAFTDDLSDTNESFENLNIGNLDKIDETKFTDGWELKLIGSHEQCGPDRMRDSYGVCQFITVNL